MMRRIQIILLSITLLFVEVLGGDTSRKIVQAVFAQSDRSVYHAITLNSQAWGVTKWAFVQIVPGVKERDRLIIQEGFWPEKEGWMMWVPSLKDELPELTRFVYLSREGSIVLAQDFLFYGNTPGEKNVKMLDLLAWKERGTWHVKKLVSENSEVISEREDLKLLPAPKAGQVEIVRKGDLGEEPPRADLAEEFPTVETFDPGNILTIKLKDGKPGLLTKATTPYDENIVGIVSFNPFEVMGRGSAPEEQGSPVALVGRVPAKVSNINGPIKVGDPITSSEIPGVGMKATRPGMIVGRALEDFDESEASPCPSPWEKYKCGKVLVFVNVSWNDPDVYLTDTGDLRIYEDTNIEYRGENNQSPMTNDQIMTNDQKPIFALIRKSTGEVISRIGAFAKVIVANLEAGEIKTQRLLGEQMEAQDLRIAGEATVSGVLRVKKLIAEEIDGLQTPMGGWEGESSASALLLASLMERVEKLETQFLATNAAQMVSQLVEEGEDLIEEATNSGLVNLTGQQLSQLSISNELVVFGKTRLADTNVAGSLTVGTIVFDGLGSSVNTPGMLKLQNLLAGGVEFLNGKIVIDTKGNLSLKKGVLMGNEQFRGKVEIPEGATEVKVERKWDTPPKVILVTPSWLTSVAVTQIEQNGFVVQFAQPPQKQEAIYWLALW